MTVGITRGGPAGHAQHGYWCGPGIDPQRTARAHDIRHGWHARPRPGEGRTDGCDKWIERERLILGDLPELSVRLLELAREHGRSTVAQAARSTRTSRNTIKDHFKALVEAGHLTRHGAGRGTWYAR